MIVVVLPWLKPHKNHMTHFIEWYAENKHKHDLVLHRSMWKALHQGQALGLKLARGINAKVDKGELSEKKRVTHLLFTEDDQWGYPIDGLDVLLEADKDVIGFKTYFKTYPFNSMAFRKNDKGISLIDTVPNLTQMEFGEGVHEVDLLSWAFTLVKMDVFDRMKDANLDPFKQWGPNPTDSFFCQYCEDLGIKKYVSFDYTIAHGEIAPNEIWSRRRIEEAQRATRGKGLGERVQMEDDYGNVMGVIDHQTEAGRALAI